MLFIENHATFPFDITRFHTIHERYLLLFYRDFQFSLSDPYIKPRKGYHGNIMAIRLLEIHANVSFHAILPPAGLSYLKSGLKNI